MNDTDLLTRLHQIGDHLDEEAARRRQAAPAREVGVSATSSRRRTSGSGLSSKVLARAAVVALVIGLGVGLVAVTVRDVDPEPASNQPVGTPVDAQPSPAPTYDGTKLDLTLPIVGRAWADTMAFSLSADTNARLYAVWQTAMAQCMRERGFPDHQPVVYPPNAPFQDRVNPLDRDYAEVMGYHELPAEPVDPNTYTDATYAALEGEDGCAEVAWDSTFGRLTYYFDENDRLRAGVASAITGFETSDEGSEVADEWSTCMKANGRSGFDSPSDAVRMYADDPHVTDDEIATRLIDLDCNLAVGYTQTQHEWEQTQLDAWQLTEQEAIGEAIAKREQLELELGAIESATYGSNPR